MVTTLILKIYERSTADLRLKVVAASLVFIANLVGCVVALFIIWREGRRWRDIDAFHWRAVDDAGRMLDAAHAITERAITTAEKAVGELESSRFQQEQDRADCDEVARLRQELEELRRANQDAATARDLARDTAARRRGPGRPKGVHGGAEQAAWIRALRAQGLSWPEVERTTGIPERTCRDRLKQYPET